MRSMKWLGGAAAAALLLCAGALAQQTLAPRSLTGVETWEAASGPAGQGFFITSSQVRNSQGVTTTAQTSGTLSGLTTTTASLVFTAASVSTTVNLPPTPFDGEIFEIINGSGGAFTQCTVATTDGSTIVNGATTSTLGTGVSTEWRYVQSTNSWYRMR